MSVSILDACVRCPCGERTEDGERRSYGSKSLIALQILAEKLIHSQQKIWLPPP